MDKSISIQGGEDFNGLKTREHFITGAFIWMTNAVLA